VTGFIVFVDPDADIPIFSCIKTNPNPIWQSYRVVEAKACPPVPKCFKTEWTQELPRFLF
jgi:hypothetical protein